MGKIYSASIVAVSVLSLFFILRPLSANAAEEQKLSPIVKELAMLLKNNPELDLSLQNAVAAQEEDSFWYGKNSDDLFSFLEEWRTFSPKLDTVMKYMDPFCLLYMRPGHRGFIEEGLEFVRNPKFAAWMKRFLDARKDFLDGPESIFVFNDWINSGKIDMGIFNQPAGGFRSFNEFFTRTLKPGARPVSEPDNDSVLVSPADCSISEISKNLTIYDDFEVKDGEYNVASLLGNIEVARKFEGGRAVLCFLNAENYHRFHAPVSGTIKNTEQLGGYYFGCKGFVSHFFEHRRGYYIIDNKNFGDVGFVAVGIGEISSVNMPLKTGSDVTKGHEIGHFAYGGSAIVLLFESGQLESIIPTGPSGGHGNPGKAVNMGSEIGRINLK